MTPSDTEAIPTATLRVLAGWQGKFTRPVLAPAVVAWLHALDPEAVEEAAVRLVTAGMLAHVGDGRYTLTDAGNLELTARRKELLHR